MSEEKNVASTGDNNADTTGKSKEGKKNYKTCNMIIISTIIALVIILEIVLIVLYCIGLKKFVSNISYDNITAIVCITAAFITVLICLTVITVKLINCCKKGKNNSEEVPDIIIEAYKKIFNYKSDNSKQSEKTNTEQGSKT